MTAPKFATLAEAADWYEAWSRDAALPLWGRAGVDELSGAFLEALTVEGAPVRAPRRARVQARQIFVFAQAARAGFGHEWLGLARRGFATYRASHQRADGLFAILADEAGRVLDRTPCLYEQAFSLLAMSALQEPGSDIESEARRLLKALEGHRHGGGFRELGAQPFQSNAQMHLLEAALAWEEAGGGAEWAKLADELVSLCLTRFIDAEGGFLREFFDAEWRIAPGDEGRWVEPGHQFEWAWLLERWGRARSDQTARKAARRLFEAGLAGVDAASGLAANVLWDDLTLRDPAARLWPHTEFLKAALILGEEAQALKAAGALARFLDTPARGVWWERIRADGAVVDEPAPATSLYHLMLAILELIERQRLKC